MRDVDRTQYPALDLLLWDVHVRYIPAKEAFAYYELRWRFMDADTLLSHEQALIDALTRHFGNNVFLPST